MEPNQPPFQTANLEELPKAIFIDLSNELIPIINLMTEFYPYYTEYDYSWTIKKLIKAISHQHDVEYQIANFAVEVISEFFEPLNCVSQAKLSDVAQVLTNVGKIVYSRIFGMSGYVYGVFPYIVKDIQLNCELYLINSMHLNNAIELNQKPFQFSY